MLRTNYRCVQSLNISVDDAKCVGKCSQIHQVHSLFVRTCPDWTIYSWRTFNSLGCPLTLRTNYRCVQSLNISVDVAKCVENVQTLIHYTHFWTVTKKDLSSLNNLFLAKFQLIRMSSYAKNKLQMCSVTQHQCRRRQMCGKCSNNSPNSLTFYPLQKTTCPDWTIYSWQTFNSLGYPLTLRTNYRCVQSLNISVDVAKCVENVQIHTLIHYTHFWTVLITKCVHNQLVVDAKCVKMFTNPPIYSWQSSLANNSLGCPLMLKTNYRCVQSLNISV